MINAKSMESVHTCSRGGKINVRLYRRPAGNDACIENFRIDVFGLFALGII